MRTTDQNRKRCWRGLGQFLLAARRWLNCTRSKRKTLYRRILQQMEGKLTQTFANEPCRFVCCLKKTHTKLISRDFPHLSPVRNQFGSVYCFISAIWLGESRFNDVRCLAINYRLSPKIPIKVIDRWRFSTVEDFISLLKSFRWCMSVWMC